MENTLKTLKKRNCVSCNYRPVNILSNVSKVYERCLYNQIHDFFENKFTRYQCGFRKCFSTQNALLSMVEKMVIVRDKKELCGAVLTDLSKAFDYISHDLLIANAKLNAKIAKLNAYGFDHNAPNVIHNYLFGRSQKTKVGSSFSVLLDI